MTAIQWIQLFAALSLLIILHEGGHFLAAKMFGIRVEKFFLFFDYKHHIISTRDAWVQRLFPRVKNWQTEYGIGWIPLGGYVKIAGMVDESMDTEQLRQPVQSWEFRAKPAWQRLIVMLGGVVANMLTAIVVYICVMWSNGADSIPMDRNFQDGFHFNQTAREMGFCNGDRIVSIDSTTVKDYNFGKIMLAMAEARTVTLLRSNYPDDPYEVEIELPTEFPILTILKEDPPFLDPVSVSVIDSVVCGSPAEKAGIRNGAQLIAVDDVEGVLANIHTWNQFDELLSRRFDALAANGCTAKDSARLRNMTIQFVNPGDTLSSLSCITLDENYRMGIYKHNVFKDVVFDHTDFTLLEAVPEGVAMGWNQLTGYVSQLKYVFSAEGARSVGSFGAIANNFPATWDWLRFWIWTAFISIMLAFMNVLPIPGLDGGHAFFTLIEMLTGYTFSEKFQERAIYVGFTLVMMLMALAIFNDIMNFAF